MMPENKTQNLPAAIAAEENTAELVCVEQSLPIMWDYLNYGVLRLKVIINAMKMK